jgi:hypothetical protein
MKKDHEIILEFMRVTVEKVNRCLSDSYAIQKLLVEKGIVSEEDIKIRLKDAQSLPQVIIGKKALEEMIENFQPKGVSNEKEDYGPVLETRRDLSSRGA